MHYRTADRMPNRHCMQLAGFNVVMVKLPVKEDALLHKCYSATTSTSVAPTLVLEPSPPELTAEVVLAGAGDTSATPASQVLINCFIKTALEAGSVTYSSMD